MIDALQAAEGFEFAHFEAADAGRLLEDDAAVAGRGLQQHVDLALLDDAVGLGAHAGAGQQVADVAQAAGAAIDEVLAFPAAIDAAGDVDLGGVQGQGVVGVVEGEGDFGRVHAPPRAGTVEDHVGHLFAAQTLDALLAQHPLDGIDDVRLPRAVGPHDDRNPGRKLEAGLVGEAFETGEFEGLEHGQGASVRGLSHHSSREAGLGGRILAGIGLCAGRPFGGVLGKLLGGASGLGKGLHLEAAGQDAGGLRLLQRLHNVGIGAAQLDDRPDHVIHLGRDEAFLVGVVGAELADGDFAVGGAGDHDLVAGAQRQRRGQVLPAAEKHHFRRASCA